MINKFLTQEEVNNLKDGTEVNILWAGGNGPGKYFIKNLNGVTYTLDFMGIIMKDPVDFVGKERYHTNVWLT